MRKYAKIDDNQSSIIENLRLLGMSVLSLASIGNGAPDILVGRHGRNWLFEIKDGSKPPSKRKLTEDEALFSSRWRGQLHKVETLKEIVDIINAS